MIDISSDDSPFKLKNHTYNLGGGFKIICNVSQNIHVFDVYHDGFPIGSVDLHILDIWHESIIRAHEQGRIMLIQASIKGPKKEQPKQRTNFFIGYSHKDNTIGDIAFCNKQGGNVFEPININIDVKELPHLCVERKVLFEKYKKPSELAFNLGEYIFGTDVWDDLDRLQIQATRIINRGKEIQNFPVVVDHLPKL